MAHLSITVLTWANVSRSEKGDRAVATGYALSATGYLM